VHILFYVSHLKVVSGTMWQITNSVSSLTLVMSGGYRSCTVCVHVCACVSILLLHTLITVAAVNCKRGRQEMCHSTVFQIYSTESDFASQVISGWELYSQGCVNQLILSGVSYSCGRRKDYCVMYLHTHDEKA